MDIQKKIREVQRDSSLTSDQKREAIRILQAQESERISAMARTAEDEQFRQSTNCSHYPHKRCGDFDFLCCDSVLSCMRCHMALYSSSSSRSDHKPVLKSIKCNTCGLRQPPSASCQNERCGTLFSKSYCPLCCIWTEATVTHCVDCGLCRVGAKDEIFHCHKCDSCYSVGQHTDCKFRSFKDQNCVFCFSQVHNSQDPAQSLTCGHASHSSCLEAAFESRFNGRCPLCRKMIVSVNWAGLKDAISFQPMPPLPLQVGDWVASPLFAEQDPSQNPSLLFQVEAHDPMTDVFVGRVVRSSANLRSPAASDLVFSRVFIHASQLGPEHLSRKWIPILCMDCEAHRFSPFHFLGMECRECGSFNTSKCQS